MAITTLDIAVFIIIGIAFVASFFLINNVLKIIKTLISEKDYYRTDLVKNFLNIGILFLLFVVFLLLLTPVYP